MKVDEESTIKLKTTIQGSVGKTLFVYLPKFLVDNGLNVEAGREIELCLDRKNKIVYFKYGFGDV